MVENAVIAVAVPCVVPAGTIVLMVVPFEVVAFVALTALVAFVALTALVAFPTVAPAAVPVKLVIVPLEGVPSAPLNCNAFAMRESFPCAAVFDVEPNRRNR